MRRRTLAAALLGLSLATTTLAACGSEADSSGSASEPTGESSTDATDAADPEASFPAVALL